MAVKQIKDLSAAVAAAGTDQIPIDAADNTTKKLLLSQVLTYITNTIDLPLSGLVNVAQDTLLSGPTGGGAGAVTTITCTSFARSVLDDTDASGARTTLGVVIGTDVQAYDATLAGIAATNPTADQLLYANGANTFTTTALTAFARTLLDDADATTALATLGGAPLASPTFTGVPAAPTAAAATNTTQIATTAFVRTEIAALLDSAPGTLDTLNELAAALGDDPNFATTVTNSLATKQPLDATLTALAGVTVAANQVIYATGADAFAATGLTAFGRSIIDDADEATFKATVNLEIGVDVQAFDSDLSALAANSTSGFWARTGAGTGAARSLADGGGITWTNPAGTAGNPTPGISALQTIWCPAGFIQPSFTGGCSAATTVATAANQPDVRSCDFDNTTQEYAQFSIVFPKGWNEGTITAQFIWSHAATVTNFGVRWGIQGVAVSDDDTTAVAFGTAQEVTDTGGTTNDTYISAATSAITIGGSPLAGDIVYFRVYRDPTNGADNMAVDARLHGVRLFHTINTLDDT